MNSDFAELLQAFEYYEVEYLVVGGYAVMAYAEPRFTKDFESETLPQVCLGKHRWGEPFESLPSPC